MFKGTLILLCVSVTVPSLAKMTSEEQFRYNVGACENAMAQQASWIVAGQTGLIDIEKSKKAIDAGGGEFVFHNKAAYVKLTDETAKPEVQKLMVDYCTALLKSVSLQK